MTEQEPYRVEPSTTGTWQVVSGVLLNAVCPSKADADLVARALNAAPKLAEALKEIQGTLEKRPMSDLGYKAANRLASEATDALALWEKAND